MWERKRAHRATRSRNQALGQESLPLWFRLGLGTTFQTFLILSVIVRTPRSSKRATGQRLAASPAKPARYRESRADRHPDCPARRACLARVHSRSKSFGVAQSWSWANLVDPSRSAVPTSEALADSGAVSESLEKRVRSEFNGICHRVPSAWRHAQAETSSPARGLYRGLLTP